MEKQTVIIFFALSLRDRDMTSDEVISFWFIRVGGDMCLSLLYLENISPTIMEDIICIR